MPVTISAANQVELTLTIGRLYTMLGSTVSCVSWVAPSVSEFIFEVQEAGYGLMTGEIAQRREVGHAVSAPELWEEGLHDDQSWPARFLTTRHIA